MTVVRYPIKEIEKEFKVNQDLLDKMSMFGTTAEIAGDELEIEINPNRPDLIPMQGFLRSFKAFTGKNAGLKTYKLKEPEKSFIVKVTQNVKEVRPYTVCAIVKNLKLDDEKIKELIYTQEKLHTTIGRKRKKVAIGIYPLDKIKFPIKYDALKPGNIKFQPLGSKKELSANQILKKHPAGKEYANLLKGFSKYPVFIDSNKKILSMPPIINSHEIGKIDESTKNVFIECSGSHLPTLDKTLNIIVTAMADMGGDIYKVKIDDKPRLTTPDLTPQKTKLNIDKANNILGLNLNKKEITNLLAKMGHDYKNEVISPAWRTDILHEIDIIEDIAIAYGYENFTPEIPKVATIGKETKRSKINRKISEILIGKEMLEISSYHMIKESDAKKMRLKSVISLEDSKTEYRILRPNLLIPLLRTLSENVDAEYPQKVFEIGRVFKPELKEQNSLIIGLTPGNFTDIKQILNYLFEMIDLEYEIEESKEDSLIEGRTGKIIVNKKEIGYLGEVHPKTLNTWGLKMPLSIAEINLEEIYLLC